MKKKIVTIHWSASEMDPWTTELEIIKIKDNEIIAKTDDTRIIRQHKTDENGNIIFSIDKSYGATDLYHGYEMLAYVVNDELFK